MTEARKIPKLPDISGFYQSELPYNSGYEGFIKTSQFSDVTFSKHSLNQMLSAQQSGDKVGFMVYSTRSDVKLIGEGEADGRYRIFDINEYLGQDDDGTDYLIFKVKLPKVLHKLVIEQVTVASRDASGVPTDEQWEAIGLDTYRTGGEGYSGVTTHHDQYRIAHSRGVTTVTKVPAEKER